MAAVLRRCLHHHGGCCAADLCHSVGKVVVMSWRGFAVAVAAGVAATLIVDWIRALKHAK